MVHLFRYGVRYCNRRPAIINGLTYPPLPDGKDLSFLLSLPHHPVGGTRAPLILQQPKCAALHLMCGLRFGLSKHFEK
jgi:hypothetical protein